MQNTVEKSVRSIEHTKDVYKRQGLDGVETSEDGIVPSVSSEALEEESTDSDVKVGVLDEGVKDPNANTGLENTVSLYALGEESVAVPSELALELGFSRALPPSGFAISTRLPIFTSAVFPSE